MYSLHIKSIRLIHYLGFLMLSVLHIHDWMAKWAALLPKRRKIKALTLRCRRMNAFCVHQACMFPLTILFLQFPLLACLPGNLPGLKHTKTQQKLQILKTYIFFSTHET